MKESGGEEENQRNRKGGGRDRESVRESDEKEEMEGTGKRTQT